MKKRLCLIGLLLLAPLMAAAAELRVGERPVTSSSERISEDVYIAGSSVSSAAFAAGDLFAAGGSVTVTGSVSGDVLAGGGSVNILAPVGDDLRVGGGNVVINSKVGDDVIVGGGQVTISGEGIGGDLIAGAGALSINAPIAGNLRIGGGEVFIDSKIGGDVYFEGDKLKLGSAAVIAGDLNYSSLKEAEIADGARVLGKTNYKPSAKGDKWKPAALATALSLLVLSKFLMTFASALVFGLLLRRYSLSIVERIQDNPLVELGRGFAAFFLLPIAAFILFITVLGIPLSALALLIFGAFAVIGAVVAPIFVGSSVYRWMRKRNIYEINSVNIFLGAALYTAIGLVPFIGGLVKFALILMVIGAAVKIKWEIAKEWR